MKRLRCLGWALVVTAFALLLVRTFFFGVYNVDSPSMEPTLHGSPTDGDWLLVAYGDGAGLERYDLVVLLPPGESEPFVKRVVGLPGESVALRSGDLWIDGALVSPSLESCPLIPIFDGERSDLQREFRLGPLWERAGEGWRMDARGVDAGANAGLMYMRRSLEDGYYDPGGRFVAGAVTVADSAVECSVEVETPGFVVRLGLSEQGDTFEAALSTGEGPDARLALLRKNAAGLEVLAERDLLFPAGRRSLRLANLNDRLLFWLDDRLLLDVPYAGNHLHPTDLVKAGTSMPTDRVYLGGSAGSAVFHGIRVLRDLHYTPRGSRPLEEPLQLGPGEIFVLGDNSRQSEDGRDWGPTELSTVIGRPLGILWPPGRQRLFSRPGAESGAVSAQEVSGESAEKTPNGVETPPE